MITAMDDGRRSAKRVTAVVNGFCDIATQHQGRTQRRVEVLVDN
jgi:hypothetical protein